MAGGYPQKIPACYTGKSAAPAKTANVATASAARTQMFVSGPIIALAHTSDAKKRHQIHLAEGTLVKQASLIPRTPETRNEVCR